MNLFSRLSMFLSPPTSFVDIPLQLLFHFFQLFCRGFNTEIAMKRAMKHVEENYAVVGILEEMNKTLTVLEHYVPRFFKGALNTYWGKYSFTYLWKIHSRSVGRKFHKVCVFQKTKIDKIFTVDLTFTTYVMSN